MPTKTIYSMWVIMAVILLFSIIATRKMKDVPGLLQNIAEMAVGGLLNFFAGVLGEKKARHYFPMLGSFFVLIIVCNYSGLIPGSGDPFTVPTSVLTVTAALSTISFVAIQSSGIKKRGLGKYLGTFFKPFAFLFPILILEQFTRPLSMALRLYGNIYGEELAAETLFELFQAAILPDKNFFLPVCHIFLHSLVQLLDVRFAENFKIHFIFSFHLRIPFSIGIP